MKMRAWLSSAAVCGLLVYGAFSQPGYAAGAISYKPRTGWAVSRIDGNGSAPYCVLARRFNDNMVLTFARNEQKETSLAVDFQKPVFQAGKSYTVILSTGGALTRAYEVQPVSEKAFVIRTGQDEEFYGALRKSSRMDANIAGQVYSFDISSLGQGDTQLSGCISSLVSPAAGDDVARKPAVSTEQILATQPTSDDASRVVPRPPEAVAVPASAPVAHGDAGTSATAAQIAQQTQKIQSLQNDIESMRQENSRLSNALERERREFENKFMQQNESSSAVVEIREKLGMLERENGDLHSQLAAAQSAASQAPKASPEDAQKIESLQKQLSSLQTDNNTLRDQLENANLRASQPSAEAQSLKDRISALESDNRKLKVQVDGSKAASGDMQALEAQVAQGANQLRTLQEENAALKKNIADLKLAADSAGKSADVGAAAMDRLNGHVRDLEADNARLKAALADAAAHPVVAAAVPAASDADPVGEMGARTQVKVLETQLAALKQQKDSISAELDRFESDREQGRLAVSSDNWNLEQATRRFNEAEREIKRLGALLEDERAKCSADKVKLEGMLFDPSVAKKEQIARLMTLEDKVKQNQAVLDAQKRQYEDRIAGLEKDMKAKQDAAQGTQGDIAAMEGRIRDLQTALAGEQNRSKGLDADLAGVRTQLAGKDDQYRHTLAGLQSEKAALESSVKQARETATASAADQAGIARQIDSLRGEFAKKDSESKQVIAGLQSEKAALESALRQARETATASAADQAGIARQIDSLRNELAQKDSLGQQAIARIQAEKDQLQQALAAAQQDRTSASAAREQAQQLAASAQADYNRRVEQMKVDLSGQIDSLTAQNKDLQQALAAAKSSADVSRQTALAAQAGSKADYDKQVELIKTSLSQRIDALGKQNADLQQALAASRAQATARADYSTQVDTLKAELGGKINDLMEQNENLQNALAQVRPGSGIAAGVTPVSPAPAAVASASSAPSPVSASPVAAVAPARPQENSMPVAPAAPQTAFSTAAEIQSLLGRAGISIVGMVETIDSVSGPDFAAFRWDTGQVFGSAEQRPVKTGTGFQSMVDDYIRKTKGRCDGDFAATPTYNGGALASEISAYEIACVKGGAGSSAALLFYMDGGVFTAIAHESSPDNMDVAMDSRDKLLANVAQTRTAAR